MVDVDMKLLSKGTKEGDVLRVENGIYIVDTDADSRESATPQTTYGRTK